MKKILAIDDDKYILELLQENLKDEGIEVVTAYTEQEAVEKFEKEKPILVIIDILMPGTDTLALLRKLKEKRHMLPVITHTGFDYQDKFAAWADETEAFVVKSSDFKELIKQAKKLLID